MIEASVLAGLISLVIAFIVTPLVIKLYYKQGWLDDPKEPHAKKVHTKVLPRGGGLVIFAGILIATLLFIPLTPKVGAILTGAALLTIIGFIDDIYDISPFIRLVGGFVAGLIVVSAGIGIAYVTDPFTGGILHLDQPQIMFWLAGQSHTIWVLADIFALFFIVWNMNIVNWSKGVDGQMPGFVAIALLFVGFLSTRFIDDPAQFNVLTLSFIAAGAFLGFLAWNIYPQKIMAGYGAGSLAGYFLGVLAILSGAKVATTLMVLAIPTADALFTIMRRLLAGKSPFWGDRGHLHHKLMDVLGWSKPQIALFYWLTTLVMGLLSLFLSTAGKMITIGLCIAAVYSFLIWAKLHGPLKTRYDR